MKKKLTAAIMVLAMLFSLSVSAAPRYGEVATCKAYLKFSGTTANCSISVIGPDGADIDAAMVLYDSDGEVVATWEDLSGTSKLNYTGYIGVFRGETYKLSVSAVVDGERIRGSTTATCK